jgi:hypothetical protein
MIEIDKRSSSNEKIAPGRPYLLPKHPPRPSGRTDGHIALAGTITGEDWRNHDRETRAKARGKE